MKPRSAFIANIVLLAVYVTALPPVSLFQMWDELITFERVCCFFCP